MEANDRLDFAQPNNELSKIAESQRGILFPRNDFSPRSQSYSSVHPDAIADGDSIGRGTGLYLDVYNVQAGTSLDTAERVNNIKINKYNKDKGYTIPE
jgi:hypothetical protein